MTPNVREPLSPLMSNEVDLPEPNKIKRIVFKTAKWVWFCFIWMAQSCKELMQTGLRHSTAENRRENNEKRPELPSSPFYIPLVNMSTWSHRCKPTNPPPRVSRTLSHSYMDVGVHKSTVGCILDLPSPTSQPPLFKHSALTDFHIKRCPH